MRQGGIVPRQLSRRGRCVTHTRSVRKNNGSHLMNRRDLSLTSNRFQYVYCYHKLLLYILYIRKIFIYIHLYVYLFLCTFCVRKPHFFFLYFSLLYFLYSISKLWRWHQLQHLFQSIIFNFQLNDLLLLFVVVVLCIIFQFFCFLLSSIQ